MKFKIQNLFHISQNINKKNKTKLSQTQMGLTFLLNKKNKLTAANLLIFYKLDSTKNS